MRSLRFLLVCFAFLLVSGSAWATRINIPDPTGPVVTATETTTDFKVTFSDCSSLLPNAMPPQRGCFGFYNRSAGDWSALELTLKASQSKFNFSCNDDSPGPPVFNSSNCVYNTAAGEFELTFTDGLISNTSRAYTVITEDDLPPNALSFNATATYAVTPEPPAATLLALGGACGIALMWSRRRSGHAV